MELDSNFRVEVSRVGGFAGGVERGHLGVEWRAETLETLDAVVLGGNARSADGDRGVARLEDGGVAAHEDVSGFDGPSAAPPGLRDSTTAVLPASRKVMPMSMAGSSTSKIISGLPVTASRANVALVGEADRRGSSSEDRVNSSG